MPNQWGKINKEVNSLQGNFNRVQHALDTIASRLDKNYKTLQNTDLVVNKTEKHFQNIGKTASSISKNVAATTFNLLKWGSVGAALGLLGSAGGLFGIGSLAGGASDTRRQAQGLGVSAGELKAAQVNFQRVTDVNSVLSSIAGAQTDITKQYAFGAAQVNPNQSAAQLLPQLLKRAGEVYKGGSAATAQQRLDVSGLSALGIDVETARRMASLRKGEMDDLEKKYAADTKTLALTDALLKRWQDLDVQLIRSKTKIENVFISGLEGLVTPLDKLSDSFSNAVKAFLESPKIKEWIGDVGKKLEEFAAYLRKESGLKYFAILWDVMESSESDDSMTSLLNKLGGYVIRRRITEEDLREIEIRHEQFVEDYYTDDEDSDDDDSDDDSEEEEEDEESDKDDDKQKENTNDTQ
jgi:hypothetical protein